MGIQGKVATILNERDLIINRGSSAGVKEGMIFAILEPTIEITDPESGDSLGSITREKIRVKIVEVKGKFAVGKTYQTFSDFGLISPTKVRTLRTNVIAINLLSPEDEGRASVDVGDLVFEVEVGEEPIRPAGG